MALLDVFFKFLGVKREAVEKASAASVVATSCQAGFAR